MPRLFASNQAASIVSALSSLHLKIKPLTELRSLSLSPAMARTIPPEMIARRIAERKRVQSWTRCRLPLENRIPRYFSLERDSHKENEDWPAWLESLSSLVSAPGFLVSRIGRNMNDPEEVLFVTGKVSLILPMLSGSIYSFNFVRMD